MNTTTERLPYTQPKEWLSVTFNWIGKVLFHTVLIGCAFLSIFPFLWSAILSTRLREHIFTSDISLKLGGALFENYELLTERCHFGHQ